MTSDDPVYFDPFGALAMSPTQWAGLLMRAHRRVLEHGSPAARTPEAQEAAEQLGGAIVRRAIVRATEARREV